MTYFLKSGSTVYLKSSDELSIDQHLDNGTYLLQEDNLTKELFLQKTTDIKIDGKLYGDTLQRAKRIINTYIDRNKNTGSIFLGKKGSGKSLIMKVISEEAAKIGIPTIIVNAAYAGETMNIFFSNMGQQRVIVLFDEFDKVYDMDDQEQILTLLDGTVRSNALFLFTGNYGEIDEHMLNRPGRIFYKFQYNGIDTDFANEYCDDKLKNIEHKQDIIRFVECSQGVTFDMIQAMVEEMNRYGEDVDTALEYMNIDPYAEDVTYQINMKFNGEVVKNDFWPGVLFKPPVLENKIEINIRQDNDLQVKQCHRSNVTLDTQTEYTPMPGGILLCKVEQDGQIFEFEFVPMKSRGRMKMF